MYIGINLSRILSLCVVTQNLIAVGEKAVYIAPDLMLQSTYWYLLPFSQQLYNKIYTRNA